jgi:RimJ/RimL family protein N-acetyltransferase
VSPDLSLRPTTAEDLDFVLDAQNHPEAAPNITVRTREGHLESFADPNREHLIILSGGEPAGYALLEGFDRRHGNIEIHTLVVARRGEGIGTRALPLLLDYAFDEREAHRVWLDVVGANERARHVYERVGFTHEGAWREAWLTDDGKRDSVLFLGMLKSEWAELRERAGT